MQKSFFFYIPQCSLSILKIFSTNCHGKALCFPSIAEKSTVSLAFNHGIPVSSFLLSYKE